MLVEGIQLDSTGVKFGGAAPLRAGQFDQCGSGHGGCKVPTQHFTMVFHAFVFLQGEREREGGRERVCVSGWQCISCKGPVLDVAAAGDVSQRVSSAAL